MRDKGGRGKEEEGAGTTWEDKEEWRLRRRGDGEKGGRGGKGERG